MSNYSRLPISFRRGKGCWLWDANGDQYLDALSGIAVCGLGHAHPAVSKAIKEQADLLLHTSNLYDIEPQILLAQKLNKLCGTETAFFCNSGAEANETAIKMARRYGSERDIAEPQIIVMEGAFHGRTLATLSATGNEKAKQGFAPLVEGFIQVPYNDVDAVTALSEDKSIVAVMLEPIQGEGGINIPDENYLTAIRELCTANDWLMITDEIQSGMGRSGHWLAAQGNGVEADIITLAKGLANGVPIGACLARGKAATLLGPGSHGSTFGGNPLACRAALAVLKTIEQQDLLANASAKGAWLKQQFEKNLSGNEHIAAIRSRGLLIGIELTQPCAELVAKALEKRILINVTAGNVIRLLPPLIIDEDEAQLIVDKVCDLVTEFTAQA